MVLYQNLRKQESKVDMVVAKGTVLVKSSSKINAWFSME